MFFCFVVIIVYSLLFLIFLIFPLCLFTHVRTFVPSAPPHIIPNHFCIIFCKPYTNCTSHYDIYIYIDDERAPCAHRSTKNKRKKQKKHRTNKNNTNCNIQSPNGALHHRQDERQFDKMVSILSHWLALFCCGLTNATLVIVRLSTHFDLVHLAYIGLLYNYSWSFRQ